MNALQRSLDEAVSSQSQQQLGHQHVCVCDREREHGCYACWVASKRNKQRNANVDVARQSIDAEESVASSSAEGNIIPQPYEQLEIQQPEVQAKTYSLHKYRNLIKPFLIVASNGHIVDVWGPYSATISDASIMNDLFAEENGPLRSYFREGDVFILDRGFRDAIINLVSYNYEPHKPESLEEGETQLPTIRANKSRCVTICRWVIEVINGKFKRDYKLLIQTYFNNTCRNVMTDFRIAAALVNVFHKLITNNPEPNQS
ncbi:hypothetical protein HF086_006375 [Spodoptera exigua]|uniref:DDE Tnp4 domain-containing protein n=1 Tax=Spodoptera exigua TaxID=7107 RepID=A0A922MF42_SPOEX|nr:hypothetical protein HF086_006375 [Spodoptera exigua]